MPLPEIPREDTLTPIAKSVDSESSYLNGLLYGASYLRPMAKAALCLLVLANFPELALAAYPWWDNIQFNTTLYGFCNLHIGSDRTASVEYGALESALQPTEALGACNITTPIAPNTTYPFDSMHTLFSEIPSQTTAWSSFFTCAAKDIYTLACQSKLPAESVECLKELFANKTSNVFTGEAETMCYVSSTVTSVLGGGCALGLICCACCITALCCASLCYLFKPRNDGPAYPIMKFGNAGDYGAV